MTTITILLRGGVDFRAPTQWVSGARPLPETRERDPCLRDDRLKLWIGALPRLTDELVVVDGRSAIAHALREAGTLEHERDPTIVLEDGYEVKRATSYLGVYSVVADLPANSTVYTDLAVSSNTTYWYVVRANKDGGHSPYSDRVNGVAATTPPAAPSETGVRPIGSTQTNVWWRDNATNAEGFRIERSVDGGVSWATAATTGPAKYGGGVITDGGRTAEQPVCYRAIAFNSQGDSPPSNTACTTPPAGPTNVTATWVEGGLLITWTDNSVVEDGYEVRVANGDGYCGFSGALFPNTTSYLHVDPSGVCFGPIEVMALKDGGWSDIVTLDGGTP